MKNFKWLFLILFILGVGCTTLADQNWERKEKTMPSIYDQRIEDWQEREQDSGQSESNAGN